MQEPTRVTKLRVSNFRSIGETIEIQFTPGHPIVLVGENNAGKSNIVRAIDLIMGQNWPGTHDPDDNEFFCRDRNRKITITVDFAENGLFGGKFNRLGWVYDSSDSEKKPFFRAKPGFSGRETSFVSNDDRASCICIVIEAERNLAYQLSYSSKYTLMSRLMNRFHKALNDDGETKAELLHLFGEVRTRFNKIQPFVDFTEVLQSRLGEFSGNMTHRLEVDFEAYNPVNFFHALRLQAVEGQECRVLHEMGTGEQQILALSLAYSYAHAFHEGMILVIEEPESHLHPLAQQWLARRLRTMASDGLQLIITTHSSHFVDLLSLPNLVLVRKGEEGTNITQLTTEQLTAECIRTGAPPERTTPENILQFYAANATPEILEGLFARSIVLVEGRTEALALPEIWRRLGFDHTQNGTAIIPVGGKGNLAKWKRIFEAYRIPCFIIFDNDNKDDRKGIKRKDALFAVSVPEVNHATLIESSEWVVESRYCIFGKNYEENLRDAFSEYSSLESDAVNEGVEAKPFVARWVAERLTLDSNNVGTKKLKAIIAAILALTTEETRTP